MKQGSVMNFGDYIVKAEGKNFFAVYEEAVHHHNFITHRESWRSACKVAKLLNEAYRKGREDGMDGCRYY